MFEQKSNHRTSNESVFYTFAQLFSTVSALVSRSFHLKIELLCQFLSLAEI